MNIETMKRWVGALELAQDNLRDHGDNCFLHDEGEYNRCFCGKDSLSNHLQSCVEELDQAIEQAQKQETVATCKQSLQVQQEPVAGQPLPCPFCGHIGLDFSEGSTYRWGQATCGGCGATCGDIRREYPDEGKWHSEAIAEWNRRTAPPRQPLTDEQKRDLLFKHHWLTSIELRDAYRLGLRDGEAAHGIKGEA